MVDERLDLAAAARQLADDPVGRLDQAPQAVAVALDDLEHPPRARERRVGLPDRVVQLARPPRQPGAQLVDDQRQPLPVGHPDRGEDQVQVDRHLVAAQRDRRRLVARRAQRGRPRRARVTLDVLLADQRLRPDPAAGIGAERPEALVDLHLHAGAPVIRQLDVLDLADLGAGDLHVLAGDQVRGVVEERVDAVGLLAGTARAGQRNRGDAGRQDGQDRTRPPHLGVSPSLQTFGSSM